MEDEKNDNKLHEENIIFIFQNCIELCFNLIKF